MMVRLILVILLLSTACQQGLIPCPKVKADKVKRNHVNRKIRYAERNNTSASIANSANEQQPSRNLRANQNYVRKQTTPPLEHMNVEEWDCPKPGMKRNVPKALKDNIRKNKKAFEDYYKKRSEADSLKVR